MSVCSAPGSAVFDADCEPRQQQSLLQLPPELLAGILQWLSPRHIIAALATCSALRSAMSGAQLLKDVVCSFCPVWHVCVHVCLTDAHCWWCFCLSVCMELCGCVRPCVLALTHSSSVNLWSVVLCQFVGCWYVSVCLCPCLQVCVCVRVC